MSTKLVSALVALAALTALTGCYKSPESSTRVREDFTVERLFEHDGCTVYRFTDGGTARYFTRCDGFQTSTSWKEICGKNCTRHIEIAGGRP